MVGKILAYRERITTEVTEDTEIQMEREATTGRIIGSALRVHSALGPGLLESTYKVCLAYEFAQEGLAVQAEIALPVIYRDIKLNAGYRIDFLVANSVIVEVKAVEKILPVHYAQLLAYLKLSGRTIGLLLNFNVPRLKDGITRMAN